MRMSWTCVNVREEGDEERREEKVRLRFSKGTEGRMNTDEGRREGIMVLFVSLK